MEHRLPLNRVLGRLNLCFHVHVHFVRRVLADSATWAMLGAGSRRRRRRRVVAGVHEW